MTSVTIPNLSNTFLFQFFKLRMSTTASFRVDAALVDLSGTLHVEDDVVPGSILAVTRLKESKIPVKFLTNTTKESRTSLLTRFRRLGFHLDEKDFITSLSAARLKVEKEGLRPLLFLEDSAKEEFVGIETSGSDPDSVVVGLAPKCFDHEHMSRALNVLLRGGKLVAIHKARYYQSSEGLKVGPGCFIAGLEYSAGISAEVVGKPSPSFFKAALKSLETELGQPLTPETVVMIGDDVQDDVGGAMACGLKGILVKTGKYRTGDEFKLVTPPTAVCNDFADAIQHVLGCRT